MRFTCLAMVVGSCLFTGCASNLQPVREFAEETRKISAAFDPVLAATIQECRKKTITKLLYAGPSVKDFQPKQISEAADTTCVSIARENSAAKEIGKALADYAEKLSAIAADGVTSSVNDDYEMLAKKMADFKDIPQEHSAAVISLFKFLTRATIAQAQARALQEALDHEEAVGALGDGLVLYTQRVYGGFLAERRRDIDGLADDLRQGLVPAPPLLAKVQLMALYDESLLLDEREKVVEALRKSVVQMKAGLREFRTKLNQLSEAQRRQQAFALAKEVWALYRQLDQAF